MRVLKKLGPNAYKKPRIVIIEAVTATTANQKLATAATIAIIAEAATIVTMPSQATIVTTANQAIIMASQKLATGVHPMVIPRSFPG